MADIKRGYGVVQVTVPGTPVAKGRPRVTRGGITYTPQKTQNWEINARMLMQLAMEGAAPLHGPVRLSIHAYWPIPKSWPKWRQEQAQLEQVWHTSRPDGDNVAKAVADACDGVVVADDAQLCSVSVYKRYSCVPRVEATWTVLQGLDGKSKRAK